MWRVLATAQRCQPTRYLCIVYKMDDPALVAFLQRQLINQLTKK